MPSFNKVFDTEEEAHEAGEAVLRGYPRQAYGTTVTYAKTKDGKTVLQCWHAASCD